VVQLSDKYGGEFTQEDEAVLVQLAAIASAGIENARLYRELRVQARRKDEFLATLAHELRNPLAPVRNGLFLLERCTSLEGSAKIREMMSRQVSHMVRLIDDLLDVSRITTGKVQLRPETVELRRVLDAALEVSRPLIDRAHHELAISISEDPPLLVRVDPTRIAQVVSNLLNNAAKYTPDGGRIELSAGLERGQVTIRVRDNGAGLAADTIPEIFELFTQVGKTLDRAQGGLGIGLALVKRLVEMHGGEVQAESAGPGQGSTFIVRLPLVAAPAEDPQPPATRRTRSGSRSWRILVVDDNEDAAQTLGAVLAMSGHATRICHSGPAALKLAEAFAPEVVLLDIGLPEMDGYEVARRLRSSPAGSQLLLVAVTGWGSENDRKRTREAGFDEHLTKPIEFERLEAVLARLSPVHAL
jgi:CheY-like chemotaxis protein